ncbi:endo-1,4-beta-xylanase [Azotobacter armeniacus]
MFYVILYFFATVAVTGAYPALAQPAAIPWGVSSSASAFKNYREWFPKMTAAGITTVRLFPSWRGIETEKGTWKWDDADSLIKVASENNIEISGLLLGSPPRTKTVHAFPMENLNDWSTYVSAVVSRYKDQIRYWEVWNEGNAAFNDGHHTTSDYAKLAATSYAAAKQANPQAQVGLSVASFDAPYLNQTILAMAKAGKPNSFDYLCIHPYEIVDGLTNNNVDGEIPFLWMSRLLRNILKDSAPDRANAEIWITEVSRRIGNLNGRVVSEQEAAKALVKIYTMALAQGIAKVQWFEAQDPEGEAPGFGLLDRSGRARDSYQTLKALTTALGAMPAYQGWLALGRDGRGYGFVFEGQTAPVLIAWMPKGQTDESLLFASDVKVIDSRKGTTRTLKANQALKLTDIPVFVTGLSSDLVNQAKLNAGKNFPWGGDYTRAKTVSIQPGSINANKGIFLVGDADRPVVKFDDGSVGVKVEGDITHPVSFYVHPSFATVQTRDYYIRVAVRRLTAGNVGMNLFYEVADSQGRRPYVNKERWFGASPDTGWQTFTWQVSDAFFSKMWGYDFRIQPEQSVPFVLGKVEVSTEPFE